MASKTDKLKLNIWEETDVVNFEEINENFKKLDNMIMCVESGISQPTYYQGGYGDSMAKWHYKKYSDGTLEMSAKLEYANLKCNEKTDQGVYRSSQSLVQFPFEFKEVYDAQMHLTSNTNGLISDNAGRSIYKDLTFRLIAMAEEKEETYKQVYINVKGVYA